MYILYGLPNCLRARSMKFNKVWLWLTWALNMKIIYKLKLCGPTLPAETIFQNSGFRSMHCFAQFQQQKHCCRLLMLVMAVFTAF